MTHCHFKRYMSQLCDQLHDSVPANASFYHMIFSFTCQFPQRFDFHMIFDGDDSSLPVADTNI